METDRAALADHLPGSSRQRQSLTYRLERDQRIIHVGLVLLALWLSSETWGTIVRLPLPLRTSLSLAMVGVVGVLITRGHTIPKASLVGLGVLTMLLLPAMYGGFSDYAVRKVTRLLTQTSFLLLVPPFFLRTRAHLQFLLRAIAVITGLIATYSFFGRVEALDYSGVRLTFSGRNPIGLGRLFALGAVSSLLTMRRDRMGTLIMIFAAANAMAMIRTASRGPFWSLVLATAVLLVTSLLQRSPSNRLLKRLIRIATAALIFLAVWMASGVRGTEQFARASGLESASRQFITEQALALGQITIAGHGWGSFSELEIRHARSTFEYPHNIVVELLYEGGVLLLGAFLVFLVVVANQAKRRRFFDTFPLLTLLTVNALVSGDINDNALLLAIACWTTALGLRSRERRHSLRWQSGFRNGPLPTRHAVGVPPDLEHEPVVS